jgi:hypothetical protein
MNFDYSNCKTVKDSIIVLEMMKNKYLKSSENFLTLNNASSFPQGNEYIEVVKDL